MSVPCRSEHSQMDGREACQEGWTRLACTPSVHGPVLSSSGAVLRGMNEFFTLKGLSEKRVPGETQKQGAEDTSGAERAQGCVSVRSPSFRQPLIPRGCHSFVLAVSQAGSPAQELTVKGTMILMQGMVTTVMKVQAGVSLEGSQDTSKHLGAQFWTRDNGLWESGGFLRLAQRRKHHHHHPTLQSLLTNSQNNKGT